MNRGKSGRNDNESRDVFLAWRCRLCEPIVTLVVNTQCDNYMRSLHHVTSPVLRSQGCECKRYESFCCSRSFHWLLLRCTFILKFTHSGFCVIVSVQACHLQTMKTHPQKKKKSTSTLAPCLVIKCRCGNVFDSREKR